MDYSTPGFPVLHHLPQLAQTHVHWVGDAIQSSCPLSSPSPPALYLSHHQSFLESALCIRWPKYWTFSFSINPSNEYSGLISLGWIGWISLQSQGLSRVFSNTTVQKHQFFCAQLSNSSVLSFLYSPTVTPYMTIGKTIALTRWTFVGKVMSLLFNMLSRFIIAFLPRSKRLLISWLQSLSELFFEPICIYL